MMRCIFIIGFCVLAGAFCLLPEVQSQDTPPMADPVPMRRVLLSPDRLASYLDKAKRSALVQLTYSEFEERIKGAVQADEALKNPPRLVEARYMARLMDTALEGTAEWRVLNPAPTAGILPVPSFNLALRRARWSDNRDVLLLETQPKELGLVVEAAGPSSLTLDWSARSGPASSSLRFNLLVPAAAVASLELDLPADRLVAISRDAYLLSGPHPAADPERRIWRIGIAGKSSVDFEILRARGKGLPTPLLLSRLKATQDLMPGQLRADFDFDLAVKHGGVRELRCECSPSLRPYEVNIRNLEGWELKPSPGKGEPALLLIRLREPFQSGVLQVRCLAPLLSGNVWTAPTLGLLNTVAESESLQLRIHPEVHMEDWQAGAFRLVRTAFETDGWQQVLQLATGIEAGPNPARPSARIQTPGPEYKTRQLSWWQIGSEQTSLTAQVTYEVVRGRLFALPVQVPAGWEVDQVDMIPPDLLRSWTVQPDKIKGSTLTVDLQRPLSPTVPARLTVRARPTQPLRVPAAGLTVPLPDLVPLGARLREGALGIGISSLYQATPFASVPAVPLEWAEERAAASASTRPPALPAARPPWGKQVLDLYYPFQGQAVTGTLQLRPRSIQLRARCASDVVIASGRAVMVTRLELAPEVGSPQAVDLFISGRTAGAWDWKTVRGGNPVTRSVRNRAADLAPYLAVLGARHGLEAAGSLAVPVRGSWWRLTFAQPLRDLVILEATVELADEDIGTEPIGPLAALGSNQPLAVLALTAAGQQVAEQSSRQRLWEVPLATVPAADRLEGQVTLHLAGPDLVQVKTEGLLEVMDSGRRDPPLRSPITPSGSLVPMSPASSWRTFRYGHPPVAMSLRGGLASADRSTEAVVERASLTTTLGTGSRLLHRYRFQVWNWRQQQLPLQLPAGAILEAVKINGHWLGPMPPSAIVNGTPEFGLPVLPTAIRQSVEVVYSTDLPAWTMWATLDTPAPVPPVRTLAFRRTWRLPPNVTPLVESSFLRLPGGVEEMGNVTVDNPLQFPLFPGSSSTARQDQMLSAALAALRRHYRAGDAQPLGRVLERLDIDHLKDETLVIDALALRAAGLGPDTLLGSESWDRPPGTASGSSGAVVAPWETLGLIHLPCRTAILLTTQQQLAAWQAASRTARPVSRELADAVAEAAAFGHDRSGRFRNVPDWMQQPENNPLEDGLPSGSSGVVDALGTEWTEWEALAGTDTAGSVVVVRRSMIPIIGTVLALLLTVAALRYGPPNDRRRRRLLLLWIGCAGLGLFWLPVSLRELAWGPGLAAIGTALFWELRPIRVANPTGALSIPAGSALILLLLASGLTGQVAAPPAPPTVYLVPDKNGNLDKGIVLAPPALLDDLQTASQRGIASLRGSFLLSAEYDGQADPQSASFKAQFQVYSWSDAESTLTIPLGNVQLSEALVDGAPAFARYQRLPRESYKVRIKGRGLHTVVFHFTMALPPDDVERDVRFSIPELAQSRLTLRLAAPASHLHVVDARGAQQTTSTGPMRQLTADLGGVNLLRVRWRREDPQPGQAQISVQEAYYWHLQAAGARLLAVLQYTVSKSWETTFHIQLPSDLEVQSVETSSLPGGPPVPRLKEWQLVEQRGNRRLRLEFLHPVTQNMQVTLVLVPRQPFGKTVNLPLPTPLECKQNQGFLAYRTDGLKAEMTQHFGIDGILDAVLPKAFADAIAGPWRQARQEDLEAPTRAFGRAKGGNLQLSLRPPTALPRCTQDIKWRVEPQQAVLQASAKVTAAAPDAGPPLIEWEVPAGLQIIEVGGPQVHHWTRFGSRIQVWLQRPVAETTLQLTGWLPRPAKDQAVFNLPSVRLLDMQKQTSVVRIGSGDGVVVGPGKMQNLVPYRGAPPEPSAGPQWSFQTEQDGYGGAFPITSTAAQAAFRLLTFLEVQERELRLVATLDCDIKSGELRNLGLTLRNWDGGEVRLDAPEVARRREQRFGTSGRAWLLDLKPGVNRRFQLTLSGTLPLGATPAVYLPDIRVETSTVGPLRLERWLAVAGAGLTAEGAAGLTPAADPVAPLAQHWPREAERLRRAGGATWQVTGDDWRLRLRPRASLARPAAVRIFLMENVAVVGDGRQWLHQATYRLWHEAGADLSATLPDQAALVGVAIDGVNVPPLQLGADRLWLPLPGGAGVRTVRLCWAFAPGTESFEQPNLASPRLEGAAEGPAVWTIALPAGYQAGRRSAAGKSRTEPAKPVSAAGLELTRAEIQLQLLSWLTDRARDSSDRLYGTQALVLQDRFERMCRRAEYQLTIPGAVPNDLGPRGQTLVSWLQELRDQDTELTKTPAYERLRTEAREVQTLQPLPGLTAPAPPPAPRLVSPLEQGRPLYWQTAAGAAAPLFRLIPEGANRNRQAFTATTLLLILLFASWILSRSFKTSAWPEQLALLGVAGVLLFGTTWGLVFLVLPAAWAVVRLIHLGRWVHSLMPHHDPDDGPGVHPLPMSSP